MDHSSFQQFEVQQEDDNECGAAKCFQLDFDDRAALHLVNFYEPEFVEDRFFRWSEPVAMVRLDVPPSDYRVTIETGLLRCGGLSFPFKIFWNDQRVPKSSIKIDEGRITFCVDRDSFIRNDEQRLTFSCKPLNAENGRRQLGIPVQWVRLEQTGSTDPEFANPTKSRSRFWQRQSTAPNIRKMLGLKSPSPSLPIWEMKLPGVSTSLTGRDSKIEDQTPGTDLVIVSSVEINSRHGTGLLIQYMFEDFSQITTVSSQRCFHGDRVRSAKHFEVPFVELDRYQIYEMVLKWFKHCPPKRAYVVPYYKTELIVAIALADLFGTEICLHIMDDQCLLEEEIPLALMDEAMGRASLIFVISPEMRDAYRQRFDHNIFILPPVVPDSMLRRETASMNSAMQKTVSQTSPLKRIASRLLGKSENPESKRGIIIGNIWNEKWLEKLQETIRESGYEIDWYTNNPDAILLSSKPGQLSDSGIHLKSPLWGDDLVNELRKRPFALMPTGMLDVEEERESLARLSLPSRLPFVMSAAHIPIVVMGSAETAAAKFIDRFDLGAVVDYDAQQFKAAVDRLMSRDEQAAIQARSKELSPVFSAKKMSDWINESIELNQPADNRFEFVFSGQPATGSRPKFERRTNWNREALATMLNRLKNQGYVPDLIIDIGSGDGSWSWSAAQVFPDPKYVLIEPLLSRYNQIDREFYHRALANREILELTISNKQGETEFGDEAIQRNILLPNSFGGLSAFARQSNTIITLDQLAAEKGFAGSTLLKVDSRFAEYFVFAGGLDFIRRHVDVIFLTVELNPQHSTAKSYAEFLSLLESMGLQLVDENEAKRCPKTDILLSKNLVFVRKELVQKKLAA